MPETIAYRTPARKKAALLEFTEFLTAVVATLALMGVGEAAAALREATGLPYGCWQLALFRAAGGGLVLATVTQVGVRWRTLAVIGVLYAVPLVDSHRNAVGVTSAAVAAGVAAALAGWAIASTGRRVLAVFGALAAFTLVLTSSHLAYLVTDRPVVDIFANWGERFAVRLPATLAMAALVVWAFARWRRSRDNTPPHES